MFGLVVHGSHLMQFARAVGDFDPAFEDVRRLSTTGPDALVAPPTFLMAADHFDPSYARRPRPGASWLGSRPVSSEQQSGFHMEQHFTFRRPVRAGDVLTAESRPGATWEKSGRRAGTMTFSETFTDYCDSDGELVATARWVSAMVERNPDAPAATATAGRSSDPYVPVVDECSAAKDLAVGSAWTVVLVEELTRAQIVMYAGASGDFHPLHSDDVYARDRGHPGVFAHGMLTMGMTGRAVTDRFGHANVLSFGGRIISQVWPGDTLTARVEIIAIRKSDDGGTVADLALMTRNQQGVPVFSGAAEVRVD
ncbi:MaoC family dehydratase N-terminal domain-containing protein [Rhodococcus hoagii]|nr:MaoC family dehydratase N-terminal domain-containing protein [Prescottella equi]